MNLDHIFKRDAAIIDHEWMKKGLVTPEMPDGSLFDLNSVKNPNNIKPELEVQWGGDAGVDIPMDEPAGIVKRNLPDDAKGDVGDVIIFARDQMNRGVMGRDLSSAIRSKFSKEVIKKASKGLLDQFALEGIVGCIAVDGRGYGSCREAIRASQSSPYKKFIKYVIGCECGDPQHVPMSDRVGLFDQIEASSGNAMDDFLSSPCSHKASLVPHCRSTMLPILSGDFDPSEMNQGLTEIYDMAKLPMSEVRKLKEDNRNNKYASCKEVIQAAFRRIQELKENAEDKKYVGHVDTSQHHLEASEIEVEIASEALPQMDVDPSNPYLAQEVEPDKPYRTNFDGPMTLGSEIVAELGKQTDRSQIHVELQAGSRKAMKLNPEKKIQSRLEVERTAAEMIVEPELFETQEVDMLPLLEDEFSDTDVFEFEDSPERGNDLDIEFGGPSGGMTI